MKCHFKRATVFEVGIRISACRKAFSKHFCFLLHFCHLSRLPFCHPLNRQNVQGMAALCHAPRGLKWADAMSLTSTLWVLLFKLTCYKMFVYPLWPRSSIRKLCEQGQETGRCFLESVADLQAWGVCMKGSSKSQSSALIFIVKGERKERKPWNVTRKSGK